MNQVLEVISPSVNVIYILGRIDKSSDSSNSVMALDENLVREDSPNSTQPLVPIRWSHFFDMPYAVEYVLSTLSRSRLRDLCHVYQIPESVNSRVPTFDKWVPSCLPNEVLIFEQTLEAGLWFPIILFVRQLLPTIV